MHPITTCEHHMTYISRSLKKSEKNYSITEKELLVVMWALQKLHPYLHGTSVTVETDHRPLITLIQKNHPPGWILRWALALQEYLFTLKYCKGTENTLADTLSRTKQQATQVTTTKSTFPLRMAELAEGQHQDPTLANIIVVIQSGQPSNMC